MMVTHVVNSGKGRVADFMQAQPSDLTDSGMSWSIVTTGPYMEMLNIVSGLQNI